MGNLSPTALTRAGTGPICRLRTVGAAGLRVLGHGPAGPLLSLALAVSVGGVFLGAMHAASPSVSAEPQRPRVTAPAERPRHAVQVHTQLQAPIAGSEREEQALFIVPTAEEAERLRTRIDEENRTQEVLQRPQVRAVVLVASTSEERAHIYWAYSQINSLLVIEGQSPINIIDV